MGGFDLPDIKTYSNAILIYNIWCWYCNRLKLVEYNGLLYQYHVSMGVCRIKTAFQIYGERIDHSAKVLQQCAVHLEIN